MHHAAAEHLQFIATHWTHLRDLIDTATPATWPPTSTTDYAKALDEADAHEVATALSHVQQLTTRYDEHGRVYYECGLCDYVGEGRAHAVRGDRGPGRLAETSAPIRLHVIDACRAIEAALTHLCDEIAAEVQRPVVSGPDPSWTSKEWSAPDRELRRALVDDDSDHPHRWHYTGTRADRSAPAAAAWLLARVTGPAGPCAALNELQMHRVGRVAAEAADRMDRTLGSLLRVAAMDRRCPWCSGPMVMHRDMAANTAKVVCYEPGCRAPVPYVDGLRTWEGVRELAKLERALHHADRRRRRAEARRRQRAARRVA